MRGCLWQYRCASLKEVKTVPAVKPTKKNSIYGSGLSASGALGIPKLVVNNQGVVSKETNTPLRISSFNNKVEIKHVSSGFGFSLFASATKLFGAGLNNRYQITSKVRGTARQDYYISPKSIPIPAPDILAISSGRAHSLVLTSIGVFAFGENCFGQCGRDPSDCPEVYGNETGEICPIDVPSDSPVSRVHCSLDSSFVVTKAGEVFSFGLNEDGQCANGEYGIQHVPTKIIGDASSSRVVDISGSTDTILALSDDGNIFIWGQCEYGQGGEGNSDIQVKTSRAVPLNVGRIVSVASTSTGCLVNNEKGEVFTWGVGLLGLGPSTQRLTRPTKIDEPLFDKMAVSRVLAGNTSMGALTEDGRLFAWGQNRFGLLGLGHAKDQYFPYQVTLPGSCKFASFGPDHSIFLMK